MISIKINKEIKLILSFSRSDEFLTGERPFQCPVCDSLELFFQGDKLTEHAR